MDAKVSRMTNPMLRRLAKVDTAATGETSTYAGIVIKTLYFLVTTIIGVFLYFIINRILGNAGVEGFESDGLMVYVPEVWILGGAVIVALVTPFLGCRFLGGLPVFGTIYAVCQGYVIGTLSNVYAADPQLKGIVLLALGLTLLVLLTMLALYSSGAIKVTNRFKTVLFTFLIVMAVGSLLVFLSSFIFPNNPIIDLVYGNSLLSILISAGGVLLAAFFLLWDFEIIRQTVDEKLPRQYEWYAAFGLTITILWLYLKILSLLVRIMGKNE